ncbi:MAG TPA: NAD(P)-dependent oxidoreductase [Chthonomonadaceae bacterium]|nr:NAD(P)-dependent oxidoreductase [Chthonomonadaceae bacterium]
MRLLVIGGSGKVGSLVLPHLAQHHSLRVFDLRPPANPAWEYIAGNVGDPDALARAAEGREALLYMAMGSTQWRSGEGLTSAFDVNVKGVYLALRAAHQAGISHAVYTSSMSVYTNLYARHFADEEVPPDATDLYGFTKRLGEEVCRNAAREWGLTVNVLRLCFPTADEKWYADTKPGKTTLATTATDLARALHAALERRFGGFQAFMISGDYEHKILNMSKARRLLDWEPLARPR